MQRLSRESCLLSPTCLSTAMHVPAPNESSAQDVAFAIADLVARGGVAVLSGAGISTDSGIPDYRGPDGQRRVQPMTIAEFRQGPGQRQRYWARAYVGWDRFCSARPNASHVAVVQLQRHAFVGTVITQNVDGLHQQAGAVDVIELHGSLAVVRCLTCERHYRRAEIQDQLSALNPDFAALTGRMTAGLPVIQPDGDVALVEELVRRFRHPRCPGCGGDELKPDVVFFGENVPRERVDACMEVVDTAAALLVLGSSLRVMSGLRFVRRAHARGIPVAAITRGPTRGDELISHRLDGDLASALGTLVSRLTAGAQPG